MRQNPSLPVVGLLDGYREDGELYGYPILSLQEAFERGARTIIVIARPGSCKAIAKRIGAFCAENRVALMDVRGQDLLAPKTAAYDLSGIRGYTKAELRKKIEHADVVSFDLFDTLITRKALSYTDIFELLALRLAECGIGMLNFAALRLAAEKELSRDFAPTLEEIYERVLLNAKISVTAAELAEQEWKLDYSTMLPRLEMCAILREAAASGKRIVVTTDSYYRREQIEQILKSAGITETEDILVSCEYGVSKAQGLFNELVKRSRGASALHIGDDETADIRSAGQKGIDTFRVYSCAELFDELGCFGTEKQIGTLSDRLKAGLLISRLFNDPFLFEHTEHEIVIADAYGIGYLFCAPVITDFMLWLRRKIREQGIKRILFGARDGYLPERLYHRLTNETDTNYFLTSRVAALRAGVESAEDIAYVDGMRYFGTDEDETRARFGVEAGENRENTILQHAVQLRVNYKKYIDALSLPEGKIAFFDFVAKGTTQYFLQRLFAQPLTGFYFLRLEPEYMADKGMKIEAFYTDEERDTSAIFDLYYILETLLTAPCGALEEFDDNGMPVYARETRSGQDLACIARMQQGVSDYFEEYLALLPERARAENKVMDEKILSLVKYVKIRDEDFLLLQVEDPFFGRSTKVHDLT